MDILSEDDINHFDKESLFRDIVKHYFNLSLLEQSFERIITVNSIVYEEPSIYKYYNKGVLLSAKPESLAIYTVYKHCPIILYADEVKIDNNSTIVVIHLKFLFKNTEPVQISLYSNYKESILRDYIYGEKTDFKNLFLKKLFHSCRYA